MESSEASVKMLRRTMVEFETWISIGLEQCAPTGEGSGRERQRVFSGLVDGWNREKDEIREMTEREVRSSLNCP